MVCEKNKRQMKPMKKVEERGKKMELRGPKSMRSFGKQENRKLGNLLIVSCTILSLFILSLVKNHYCPAPYVKSQATLKLQVSEKDDVKMVTYESVENSSSMQEDEDDDEGPKPAPTTTAKTRPICYESSRRSDTCEAEGDIRVQSSSKTIFMASVPTNSQQWKIKPYTRKSDPAALSHVQEWSLRPPSTAPPRCTKNHSAPAIVFSIGGFTGNLFHDYTDVLIPLYITSRHFHGEVHFLVSDTKPWWLPRFSRILEQLTNHEIVDTDSDSEVRCYPRLIAGPTFHNELAIDAGKKNNVSMPEFRALLRAAFGLPRPNAATGSPARPRLLIISRKRSRAFVNERAMVAMATSLGLDVRVGEPDMNTDTGKFARLVNWADVLLGVHGAGLTNMVYLPAGAVVVQVVPLGGLEWLARGTFKEPAEGMGVEYLEYVIDEEESTLIEQYSRDHPVIRDPMSVHKQGWMALREVYLDKQNVRLKLGRLRNTLLEAISLLPKRG